MSVFTHHLLLDCIQFTLIHGPNIPGFYAILLFTASDLASITNPIHNWVLFLLWVCPFILSEVISPLISSSIFGTCPPGEFIFQCPIFLPLHTVHRVLNGRILKWFAIAFCSGPHFVRRRLEHSKFGVSVLYPVTRSSLWVLISGEGSGLETQIWESPASNWNWQGWGWPKGSNYEEKVKIKQD